MEVALPEVAELVQKVEQLTKEISEIKETLTPSQRWYDLKSACQLKGVNYNTVVSTHKYQPNGGIEDAMICGRKRWYRETVLEWIEQVDSDRRKAA